MTEIAHAEPAQAQPPSFPMTRGCPMHPPQAYAELRDKEPVSRITLPTGRTAWLVTRHDLARKLLADPRVSVNRAHPGYPALVAGAQGMGAAVKGFLTWMDPPEHTEHRKMLINEFTAARLAALRPQVQRIVEDCVAGLLAAGPPADLVAHLSLAVPSLVICELLGVPYQDRELFHQRAATLDARNSTPQEKMEAFKGLRGYIGALVTAKTEDPGDDLLSRLAARYRQADAYDHDLLVGEATLLLTGGFETTANMISLGVLALLQDDEQRAKVVAGAPGAADELLRYFSIAEISTSRVLTEDVELGGVTMRAGEGVIVSNTAADWDPAVFSDPERLDVERPEAKHHLAFGFGVHQCLGQNLARMELQVLYATLFQQVPTLRLAVPMEELRFKKETNFYGVYEMPVAW
ncbi:cytochrome P450 [Streptomyces sp. NPDC056161]|uniref:cytochrome P450 n=1 Tax=Streptomyces sp. NPDC056161 TaxID=3345732 RepID=UPI0035E0C2EA